MKSKFLTWVSALGAVALVSGALVVSANAHIGADHSPYNTDGPDLRSATVTGDTDVEYCFDDEVAEEDANAVGDYELRGFDSDQRLDAIDVDLGSEDECVDVTFDPPNDMEVAEYTIATVEAEQVETRGGDVAPKGAVGLTGSTAPGTGSDVTSAAPNLTTWTEHSATQTISYFFDESVDCDQLTDPAGDDDDDAENFGFYQEDEGTAAGIEDMNDRNAEVSIGDSIIDCDDNEVEVQFSADDPEAIGGAPLDDVDQNPNGGEDVEDAEKVFVSDSFSSAGEVCDNDSQNGGDADDACLDREDESSEESIDDAPDLEDIERTDDTQFTYTFDEEVDDDAALVLDGEFYIAFDDGQEFVADTDECDADGNEVECDFDTAGGPANLDEMEDDEITYGGNGECAVVTDESAAADRRCATIGDAPIGETTEGEGVSDAPDLEDCDIDVAGEQATFFYDEDIDEDADPQGDDFYYFDVEGDETDGDTGDVDDFEGNSVTVDFEGEDIQDAIGCGSVEDAVEDEAGNGSIEATVGTEAASSAAPTTSTTTSVSTVTTTTSQPPPPPPAKRKVATNVSKPGYANNRFRGSVNSSVKNCQKGRGMKLKRHVPGKNRTVGTGKSGRSGNYKFLERNARGRYYVVAAKKKFTNRKGTVIVCRRDKSPTGVVK